MARHVGQRFLESQEKMVSPFGIESVLRIHVLYLQPAAD